MSTKYIQTDADRTRLLSDARATLKRYAHETGASFDQMWAAIERGWAELQHPRWRRTAAFRGGFELYACREAAAATGWAERLVPPGLVIADEADVITADDRKSLAYLASFLDGYKAPEQIGCAAWDIAETIKRLGQQP